MKGNWYKGNIHMHTSNSDGALSPSEMAAAYKASGYHFLVITDHFKMTDVAGLSDDEMVVIAGEETNPTGVSGLGCDFEFLAMGLNREVSFSHIKNPDIDPQTAIDIIREYGGEAVLAHPYFSHLTLADILPLKGLSGIEIFNPVFGLGGRSYSLVHWDELLSSGARLWGFAGDDSHKAVHPSAGYIMVKAESLSAEAIMKSVREGLFYASNGPRISDITLEEQSVSVTTSDVRFINFVGDVSFPLGSVAAPEGKCINAAAYNIKPDGRHKYLRIECTDESGRSAWSNPVFFYKQGI